MRMWMIDPKLLCRKHLLGEHNEIHKHKHSFEKGHSIKGRISPIVQIQPSAMQSRHDELAMEMVARNMNHKSPYIMPTLDYLSEDEKNIKVDIDYNINDLKNRCPECKSILDNHLR